MRLTFISVQVLTQFTYAQTHVDQVAFFFVRGLFTMSLFIQHALVSVSSAPFAREKPSQPRVEAHVCWQSLSVPLLGLPGRSDVAVVNTTKSALATV